MLEAPSSRIDVANDRKICSIRDVSIAHKSCANTVKIARRRIVHTCFARKGKLSSKCHLRFSSFFFMIDGRACMTRNSIVTDQATDHALGLPTADVCLHEAPNVFPQTLLVDKQARRATKRQRSCAIWLTGLSASGKTTIATRLDQRLHMLGYHTYLLDGDNLRLGLNRDLGFSATDRTENVRRAAEVAKLMVDAGLLVSCAFISPFRAEREMVRAMFEDNEFFEIYVNTPVDIAEKRDPKGLYKRARRGELSGFTGIDSPYEAPLDPDVLIDTMSHSVDQAVDMILLKLRKAGAID
ncbi:TPA: adenylyl-sulfate kinase [Burkholderia multivorans]|nr:adenylyl-sulfate kinase [Burkholderia multivorans]MBU9350648.1 adenylyl-sulfate kinase [Burkholderia multivorans]MBU9391155.1 adenylyl-sulfate kinase [Burkholderia multivorans]MBU9397471.1 adenylyl-sulfate kinase [Burkholderia multivorans]MBU9420027.1 adenylyl-sulfate kinase [Burkholderia multivorans]